ncbi:hypothetical protein O3P69_011416 [Scylla paramamosain]|uniref:SHSP domain-containing protein n=1 Tax=Scylla paramamosain TaxID=85552 RepID=A0AAW0T607_SCYPA
MAPTHQSSVLAENSEMATKTTSDSTNMVHSIKKESHSNSSSSSSSTTSSNEINDRLFGTSQEMLLPITSRGHFFRDAFFQDARQHFEGAVTNVLDQWGRRSSVQDDLTSYRMLRRADLSENSQAVTVTEDSTCHKVVIDVQDFKDGGVSVKVVDEDLVVVEGSMEQQNGGSVSKKSFRRSFAFPGLVKGAGVASTMSADGILTITVPKKENITQLTDINIQRSSNKANRTAETTKVSAESAHQTSERQSQKASSLASNETTHKNSLTKDSKEVHQATSGTNSTTETTFKKSVCENSFPVQPSDFLLPISHSGPFFQDSFFTQAHQEFEEAMKKVLNTVGESPRSDVMTSYRSLREQNLTEENQALSVTEDSHQHKVVIDVRDFMAGDLKVKVVDEDQVVVEGSVEQQNGGSLSKKSFRRSFNFPGLVKAADIASTMSSDGILTITVPKKESAAQLTDISIQRSSSKANREAETTEVSAESAHQTSETQSQKASSLVSNETTHKNSLTKDSKEVHQATSGTNSTTETTCKKSVCENSFPVQPSDLLLPISHSGPFFQDSFFTQAHQEFEEAMKKVLNTFGESPRADVMTSYRSLREQNLTEENQAVSVTEDSHQHKVVIDVKDFMDGDVKVKVVDEDQVVVEGSVEQQNRGSLSKKSFRRSFNFPGLVKAADITSTMSSDGVLTVIVPKKESVAQLTDINIQRSSSKANRAAETTKVGPFFQDSFFTQAHQEFEEAMKKMLNTVGESPRADVMTSYRSLREQNLTEENQAVSVTEDSHQHKVVIDVKDFMDGDVKVKVVDEDQVVVEGSVEQQNRGSLSKKSFRRSFNFPGLVKAADITSTMSSDGVLTVIVPKKESVAQLTDINIQRSSSKVNRAAETTEVSAESDHQISERQSQKASSLASNETTNKNSLTKDSKEVHQATSGTNSTTETTCKKADVMASYRSLREQNLTEENQAVSVTEDSHQHKVVIDVKDFTAGDLKVKVVDEDQVVVEGSVEQQNGGSLSKKSFCRSFNFPGLVKAADITSTMSSDGILTITVPKKEDVQMIASNFKMVNAGNTSKAELSSINSSSKLMKESNSKTSIHTETAVDTEKQVSSNTTCSDKWETDSNYSVESTKIGNGHLDAKRRSSWELDSLLPVFPKGPFFHDSYFKESRQHFDAAVKEALSRLGHEETQTDNFSLYRNLRMSDMTDHSQAVKVTENEQVHQVVLDVHDFLGGDIKVKVVGRNEVEVEGRIEKEEGGCMSMQSFCRSFHLPGVVDVDAVTSCLSSDGVLTIKAPKGAAGAGRGGC